MDTTNFPIKFKSKRPRMSLSFMYNNRLDVVERIDTTYATPVRSPYSTFIRTWCERSSGAVPVWMRNVLVQKQCCVLAILCPRRFSDIIMLVTTTYWSISMVRRHCPFCYEAILYDLIGAFGGLCSVSAWRNSRRDYNH